VKFTCPACQAKLTINDERIPEAGAWARCPKCQDRFFIPPKNKALGLDRTDANGPPRLNLERGEAREKILARARSINGASDNQAAAEFDPEAVVVIYPDLQQRSLLLNVAIGFFIVLPLIALLVAFKASSRIPTDASQAEVVTVARVTDKDNSALIRSDLVSLRRKMIRQGRFSVGVESSSAETRVFNYYMDRLVPGACQGISYIEVSSSSPVNGFKAVATCRENPHKKLEMLVEWPNNTAVITFPDYRSRETVEMNPPPRKSST